MEHKTIIDAFNNLGFWGVVFIIFTAFLVNPQKFKELLELIFYTRSRKLSLKTKAIESNYLDPLTHEAIREQITIDYFYESTGIKASSELRKTLLYLIKYSNFDISLHDFKKAKSYLTIKNKQLVVNPPKYSSLLKRISSLLFFFFTVSSIIYTSLIIFKLANIYQTIPLEKTLIISLATIVQIIMNLLGAFIFLNAKTEIEAAEKIQNYLKQNPEFNNDIYKKKNLNL